MLNGARGKGGTHVPKTPWVASSSESSGEDADATKGLRRPVIRVITSARTGGASRAPHPRRIGASACSAKGWSATQPDRSARVGEPCGLATPLGDGSRSSWPPYCDEAIAAAAGRRTEGVNPLAPGSRCEDGRDLRIPAVLFFLRIDLVARWFGLWFFPAAAHPPITCISIDPPTV